VLAYNRRMPTTGPLELLVTLVIAAIYLVPLAIVIVLIRRWRSRANDPIDVLRVRLARGEIDEPEFERLSLVIRGR
jgi:uncharacterized membrane protein